MDYIFYILNLPLYVQILGAIFIVAFLIQSYYYFYYYSGLLFHKRKTRKRKIAYVQNKPPVSVIICAKDEAENLKNFLPVVLEQNYPEYEVIVVNDGSSDESNVVLERYMEKYPHLYHTFLPADAKYMSRKKICLTVGIKAAKHENLLLIDADCQPNSKEWINNMVRNFVEKSEIVLGYSGHKYKKGLLNRMISFDTLFIAIQYLGFALKRKPYMGVGGNLSYKKELFFRNKGFASHLNLVSGDDDLFIKEVATKKNTRVEFSAESVTWSERKMTFKTFIYQKEKRLTTRSYYTFSTRLRIKTEIFSRALFYLLFILLSAYFVYIRDYIAAGAVGGLFLFRYIYQLIIINRTAKIIREKRTISSLLLFDIFLPLLSFYIMTFGRIGTKKQSMWK
jgi:cellulose synthase/poly-beta-1,6-N-acetylglucosamine synthase-like glycosyltransferase